MRLRLDLETRHVVLVKYLLDESTATQTLVSLETNLLARPASHEPKAQSRKVKRDMSGPR